MNSSKPLFCIDKKLEKYNFCKSYFIINKRKLIRYCFVKLYLLSLRLFFCGFVALVACSFSSAEEDTEENPSWMFSKDKKKQKLGLVPSYYRNATFEHIGSLRLFVYPTGDIGYYTALDARLSKDLFFSSSYSYQRWLENGSQLDFFAGYDGFHDFYYGQGSHTTPEDQQIIPSNKWSSQLEYVFKIGPSTFTGLFVQFLYRKEKDKQKVFSDEWTFGGGVLLRFDSRDNYFNPHKGEYYEIRTWARTKWPTPIFLEGDMRLFFPFAEDNLVMAVRFKGGTTFVKSSSYLFRFHLGGPDSLRGFRLNRFHGEQYYLSQLELRYTPFSFLSFVVFCDVGAAAMKKSFVNNFSNMNNEEQKKFDLSKARYSYGGGVRLGLPPDYNKKIRIEFGKGEDQTNFVVAFGHPF